MLKKNLIFVWFLGCFLLNAEAKKIVFVVDDYPPYHYSDANNNVVGRALAVAQKVADNANLDVTFKVLPWEECLSRVKNGSADGILTIFKTKEREKFLYFPSFGIDEGQFVVFTSPSYKGKKIIQINDLKGLRVGLIKGYAYPNEVISYNKCDKIEKTTQKELMKLLAEEKIDAMIGDIKVGRFYLDQFDPKKRCNLMPAVFLRKPYYLAISKQNPNSKELYDKINKELKKIKFNGEMFKIQSSFE